MEGLLEVSEGSYGITESFFRAHSEDGGELLSELRSSAKSDLPLTYDEIVEKYGLAEQGLERQRISKQQTPT